VAKTPVTQPIPSYIFALTHTYGGSDHGTMRNYMSVATAAAGWLDHGPRSAHPSHGRHDRFDFRVLTDGSLPPVDLNNLAQDVVLPADNRAAAKAAVVAAITRALHGAGWPV
jgi:hypothetical protein